MAGFEGGHIERFGQTCYYYYCDYFITIVTIIAIVADAQVSIFESCSGAREGWTVLGVKWQVFYHRILCNVVELQCLIITCCKTCEHRSLAPHRSTGPHSSRNPRGPPGLHRTF